MGSEFIVITSVIGMCVLWLLTCLLVIAATLSGIWLWWEFAWKNATSSYDVREALMFYRQYHGQLKRGKLVCPKCALQDKD